MVPVVIFLKDNRNRVFLTVLDTPSSRAASLIPVFLISKPLLMALGKFTFLHMVFLKGQWTAEMHQYCLTLLIHMTPEVPLYLLGHAVIGQCLSKALSSMLIHDLTSPTIFKNTFKSLTQIINLKSEYFGLVYKVTKNALKTQVRINYSLSGIKWIAVMVSSETCRNFAM